MNRAGVNLGLIAEVSSNHHRDLDRCLEFVDVSANIGCTAVKFQLFRVSELFAPEILERQADLRRRVEWELPVEFLEPIAARCQAKRVQFACTPFHLEAVRQLEPYVAFYKIASYELLWDDLLIACARTGKPVVLSTGMATIDEVLRAVAVLRGSGATDVSLLHCVSGYPTPVEQCNLTAIATLREATGCPIGWSDHSVNPGVVYRAVHRWGATLIEFHLDLDGMGDEFRTGHCWLPEQAREMIAALNDGLRADGSGAKVPVACELPDREWRADPTDGLRPSVATRRRYVAEHQKDNQE